MKKILSLLLPFLLVFPLVALADFGDMMSSGNFGMMGGGGLLGMSFFGLFYFALAAFIFSLIFWSTYKWLIKK
jgi:uncharacterized membrane protein